MRHDHEESGGEPRDSQVVVLNADGIKNTQQPKSNTQTHLSDFTSELFMVLKRLAGGIEPPGGATHQSVHNAEGKELPQLCTKLSQRINFELVVTYN